MRIILKNFRIVDEEIDTLGTVIVQDGIIDEILSAEQPIDNKAAGMVIDGSALSSSGQSVVRKRSVVLMPAFVDLHAHFRDPGIHDKNVLAPSELSLPSEVIESASLAAAAGGFGTVVCMANTKPVTDTIEKAAAIKNRSDVLGLIDLYPVLSLTKGMEGKELSEITRLSKKDIPLMISEDGKDLADDDLFLAAMFEAKRIDIPVSCHCDLGGDENMAVRRAIELGKKAGCHIHIAHVSTREAIETIRSAKASVKIAAKADAKTDCFTLTCEVTPHHLYLTTEDSRRLGEKTWGAVNPPLRSEEDRLALVHALIDGTIDAIATDHAPHSRADKESGAPGFSGFETAFAAVNTIHSKTDFSGAASTASLAAFDLKRLSCLMSANPASLLGFDGGSKNCEQDQGLKRGRILPGYRADLVLIDTEAPWNVEPGSFKSRGKNSPLEGCKLFGKIMMTFHGGRLVYYSPCLLFPVYYSHQ